MKMMDLINSFVLVVLLVCMILSQKEAEKQFEATQEQLEKLKYDHGVIYSDQHLLHKEQMDSLLVIDSYLHY